MALDVISQQHFILGKDSGLDRLLNSFSPACHQIDAKLAG